MIKFKTTSVRVSYSETRSFDYQSTKFEVGISAEVAEGENHDDVVQFLEGEVSMAVGRAFQNLADAKAKK